MTTRKLLILPDIHMPNHSVGAWDIVCQVAKEWAPDICIQLGDMLDFHTVSSHSKDPRDGVLLSEELEIANECLDRLDEALDEGGCKIKHVTLGNHSARLSRYIATNAGALAGILDVVDLMRFSERGWQVTPYKQTLKIGKLHATHDFGVAGARQLIHANDVCQGNVVVGHSHRMAALYRGNSSGKSHVARSFGWLGNINKIDYLHADVAKREWQLGFGYGRMDKFGNVWLNDAPIVKNKTVVEGELYRAVVTD